MSWPLRQSEAEAKAPWSVNSFQRILLQCSNFVYRRLPTEGASPPHHPDPMPRFSAQPVAALQPLPFQGQAISQRIARGMARIKRRGGRTR